MAAQSSAAADEPIDVLFALHENFDLMDFAGTFEVLQTAQHNPEDESTKVFDITIAGGEPKVLSNQGAIIGSQISWKEAHERLSDFDVLVVLGGGVDDILKSKPRAEPLPLISAYAELQKTDPARERTLMSVCTGSLMLAELGILSGLSATTHFSRITTLEVLCSQAVIRNGADHTDVIEDARYVVNNLRFDLGDEDENPYIRRKSDASHPPNARKGSMSFKSSGRRESIARRAAMRLGGLRVITAGGVAAGMDAALYLVSILSTEQVAEHVAQWLQITWTKGVVVDGLDV